MSEQVVIIRKSFAEKAQAREQRLVTVADLSILVDRLKEQLKANQNPRLEAPLLSELKHAKKSLKMARIKAI